MDIRVGSNIFGITTMPYGSVTGGGGYNLSTSAIVKMNTNGNISLTGRVGGGTFTNTGFSSIFQVVRIA